MYKTACHLLLKNRLRLLTGLLKKQWLTLTLLVFAGGLILYELRQGISLTYHAHSSDISYETLICLFLVLIKMHPVLFPASSAPSVRIDAASILHTCHTPLFPKLLKTGWLLCFLKQLTVSFLASLLINGFPLRFFMLYHLLMLFLYLSCLSMISWIAFHGNLKKYVSAILLAGVLSFLLLASPSLHPFFRMLPWILPFFWLLFYIRRLPLNLPEYYERLRILDASDAAASQNDFYRMRQLSEANRPAVVRGITYGSLHPSKRTAFFAKAALELLRVHKNIYLVLFVLLVLSWLLLKTSLFQSLPLTETPEVRTSLSSLLIVMAVNSLHQLSLKQAADTCGKRYRGLSLPVSDRCVYRGYMLAACMDTGILSILLAIAFSRPPLKILVFWASSILSYFLLSHIPRQKQQDDGGRYTGDVRNRILTLASTVLLLSGSLWCFS